MEREYSTRILKVLSSGQPTHELIEEALAHSQEATPAAFPKRQIIAVGQCLKPRAYEAAEAVLKSLSSKFTKVFLVCAYEQLLTLLSVCLSSRHSTQICEIALQYTQQLIEAMPLLTFRRIHDEVVMELYTLLMHFSGMLAMLIPHTLQNGNMNRILKILYGLNKQVTNEQHAKTIGEMLLVESVATRLDDESKKHFFCFMKSIVKGEFKENLFNCILSSQQDRVLEFSRLVIFRVVDDGLEKADLNLGMRSKELFLLPTSQACWPEWVAQSYQRKPEMASVQPLVQSAKVQEVFQSFQHLELWASSPKIEDPSLMLNDEITDLFINYLEGRPFTQAKYQFKMEKWREKCKQIQEMMADLRDRQRTVVKDLLTAVL